MIHVQLQPEPLDFDATVRTPGQKALGKRKSKKCVALPPLWQRCIPALRRAYRDICAYTCIRIQPVVGSSSVDHLLPKSQDPHLAYEWSNYRLACARMNARKNILTSILDPFEVDDGWFALEFFGHQVRPVKGVSADLRARIQLTIDKLRLNDDQCCALRQEFYDRYQSGHLSLAVLDRDAPFIARELRRQNLLRMQDRVAQASRRER